MKRGTVLAEPAHCRRCCKGHIWDLHVHSFILSACAEPGPVLSTLTHREQADHIDQQTANCWKVGADGPREGKKAMSADPGKNCWVGT